MLLLTKVILFCGDLIFNWYFKQKWLYIIGFLQRLPEFDVDEDVYFTEFSHWCAEYNVQ